MGELRSSRRERGRPLRRRQAWTRSATPSTRTTGAFVQPAMRPEQFLRMMTELLDAILAVQLVDEVFKWVRGEVGTLPIEQIRARSKALRAGLKMGGSHSYSASKQRASELGDVALRRTSPSRAGLRTVCTYWSSAGQHRRRRTSRSARAPTTRRGSSQSAARRSGNGSGRQR